MGAERSLNINCVRLYFSRLFAQPPRPHSVFFVLLSVHMTRKIKPWYSGYFEPWECLRPCLRQQKRAKIRFLMKLTAEQKRILYFAVTFYFAVEIMLFILPWRILFCRGNYIILPWRILFCRGNYIILPWTTLFCSEQLYFAVNNFILPWQLWATVISSYICLSWNCTRAKLVASS